MRILIVDDQPTNRKLLRGQLEAENHRVVEAVDGVEALETLASGPVEAIVSDILMPNMDGFRLCHEVRADRRFSTLPFIIYTNTYDSPSDRELGESVGADCYLVRPAAVEAILAAIAKAKDRHEDSAPRVMAGNNEYIVRHYNSALVSKLEQKNVQLAKANQQLALVRDQLKRLLDHSPAVIYSLKLEGDRITPFLVSENVTRLLGFSMEEALGANWWADHVHPEDIDRVSSSTQKAINTGSRVIQYRVRHKHGHYVWVEDSQRTVLDGAGNPMEIAGVWTDITTRKQDEERLREQARLLDIASDAIIVEDLKGLIQYWSKGAERLFGWTREEAQGRSAGEILVRCSDSLAEARSILLQRGECSRETSERTKSGGEVILQSRWTLLYDEPGRPTAVLSIITDITEKKQLEAQFLRAQRLESIGTLASGIAHDLNNVLAPVMMSLSLLKEMTNDPASQQVLENLSLSTQRGAEIIRRLLTFGRGMQGEHLPLDPSGLINEIRRIVIETFPKDIRLEADVAPELPPVTGDSTQLHQILLNLCINARDAMPQGGRLIISAHCVTLGENDIELELGCDPGTYVRFEVSDTGIGIPSELRARIFEPFFTTKDLGRGTGLGLSTVVAILKGHRGFIRVESEMGRGSRFRVYIPAIATATESASHEQPLAIRQVQGEIILLVDDEPTVLAVTERALERFGYKVVTASNGAEALALYAKNQNEISVVVTDMAMPVMDGAGLVKSLLKLNPDVRVIAASGCGSESHLVKAVEEDVSRCLQKPYQIELLLGALQEAV